MGKVRKGSLRQELGDKKYFQAVEKENKRYDTYMAGKRNPKTGEYYHPISFNNPNKSKITSSNIGSMQCKCGEWFSVTRSTVCVICSKCKALNSISKEDIEELLYATK